MRITDELIQRSRTVSQESYHSNPKSWSDFSAETKEWRVSDVFYLIYFHKIHQLKNRFKARKNGLFYNSQTIL